MSRFRWWKAYAAMSVILAADLGFMTEDGWPWRSILTIGVVLVVFCGIMWTHYYSDT